MKLWEAKHPYYASEAEYHTGNQFGKNWGRKQFASWPAFLEDFGGSDPDLNLLFRWDWVKPDPVDYEEGQMPDHDSLWLFFVLQRKGHVPAGGGEGH